MKGTSGISSGNKVQRLINGLLFLAILTAAAVPNPWPRENHRQGRLFYFAEEDYNTPFFGSYMGIRSLPFESTSFAGFAGFEQHTGQYRTARHGGLAQVTSYAGKLLELAGIQFVARASSPARAAGPGVYLSERFWRRNFAASLEVLGKVIEVDGRPARIAGIVHNQSNLFSPTDIWVPMRVHQTVARGESLRILGKLNPAVTWADARKELSRLARRPSSEYRHYRFCTLIPVAAGIPFETRPVDLVFHLPISAPEKS